MRPWAARRPYWGNPRFYGACLFCSHSAGLSHAAQVLPVLQSSPFAQVTHPLCQGPSRPSSSSAYLRMARRLAHGTLVSAARCYRRAANRPNTWLVKACAGGVERRGQTMAVPSGQGTGQRRAPGINPVWKAAIPACDRTHSPPDCHLGLPRDRKSHTPQGRWQSKHAQARSAAAQYCPAPGPAA